MTFLKWLAADPERYLVVSAVPLFAYAAIAVAGTWSQRANTWLGTRKGIALILALAGVVLLAARWPTLFVRDPLNQDEAQALAQAITALRDAIPWRGFDPNTCGPLNTYVLMLPAALGLHLTFLTTRVIALLLEWGAIASLYICAALCFEASLARVALVAPLAFFALVREDHFVHYSGEHLSIFLGMLALALLCGAHRRGLRAASLFSAGVPIGMMPFAKLQSLPLAASTAFVALAIIVVRGQPGARATLRRLAAFAAGIVAVPVAIVGMTAAGGALRDFWISYVQTSLAYILYEDQPVGFLTGTPEFGPLFDVLLAFSAIGLIVLVWRYRTISPLQRGACAASLVVLIGAVWTVFAPKRGSLNYLLFAVMPASAAAAAGIGVALSALSEHASRLLPAVRAGIGMIVVLVVLGAMSAFDRPAYPYLGSVANYFDGSPDAVTQLIAAHVSPGERIAIWGWRPKYYVTTYTVMGTRDAITQYQYSPNFNPYRNYFRSRYVNDMLTNKPVAFLDAGSDSFDFEGKGRFGYESFPELAEIVDRDYRLAGEANGIRLFLRHSRS
ncbi:MAG: hypothetical protein JO043_09430 [Candidatus Eremiobacteraeota bacterium]|nr:hypothetical protein [Candidatus Eremiobacteraeota bacterium]